MYNHIHVYILYIYIHISFYFECIFCVYCKGTKGKLNCTSICQTVNICKKKYSHISYKQIHVIHRNIYVYNSNIFHIYLYINVYPNIKMLVVLRVKVC